MLIDEMKLDEQLSGDIDGAGRPIYLMLAHAKLPNNMTVRPSEHGYISRELRFELDGRWYFSAVLNRNWVLWYFRRPALAASDVEPEEIIEIFPSAEITGQNAVKLRLPDFTTTFAVLGWLSQMIR